MTETSPWIEGFRWIGTQVKRPEVQDVWREHIVRPCLQSLLDSFFNEYLHTIVTAIAVWTCLLAILLCVMVRACKLW